MTRRNFMAAGAALAAAPALAPAKAWGMAAPNRAPNLKVGIVSDIHVTKRENATTFEKALLWFRDKDVDAVMVPGDLCTTGRIEELEIVAETWYKVFPGDRAPNGKRVERLFITGNHDVDGFVSKASWPKRQIPSREEAERICFAFNREETWGRLFGEEYRQITVKEVNGYRFVLNGWHSRALEEKDELEDFWKGFAPTVDMSKPLFYCQHPHPRDTCAAGYLLGGSFWEGGWDSGLSTRLLSGFPNAIALSGHSHYPIDDERSIWQGAFTSVNCGCARGFAFTFPGRENGHAVPDMKSGARLQMPPIDIKRIRQGMLMTVYDDRVVFHRREFVFDRVLGPDWVVPIGDGAPRPYVFEPRKAASVAPQFGKGASVTVEEVADGRDRSGAATPQVAVSFPGTAAYDYEVDAIVRIADTTRPCASKRVFAPDAFTGAPEREREAAKCVFARSELPSGRDVRFMVRPFNCWGRAGAPISSEWVRFA